MGKKIKRLTEDERKDMKNFLKMASDVSRHMWKNFKYSKTFFPKLNGDAAVVELHKEKPKNILRRKKHVIFNSADVAVQND